MSSPNNFIFLPEIFDIILSFLANKKKESMKSIFKLFFVSRDSLKFVTMKEIYNKNTLSYVFKKIAGSKKKISSKEIIDTLVKKVHPKLCKNFGVKNSIENSNYDFMEIILKNISQVKINKEQILQIVKKNDHRMLELIEKYIVIDYSVNSIQIIECILAKNSFEILKLVLKDPNVNPGMIQNYPIRIASYYGHYDIVKLLLEDSRVNPGDLKSCAIGWASEKGHENIVELLLNNPKVNPEDADNFALKSAVEGMHYKIVELLLDDLRVDPNALNGEIFYIAAKSKNIDILELLLKDSRTDLSTMNAKYYFFVKNFIFVSKK